MRVPACFVTYQFIVLAINTLAYFLVWYADSRVVQFGVRSKVWVRKLSCILINPKKAKRMKFKVCWT